MSGAIELAKKAQTQGWGVVVAAETEAGETDDTFVAHFAVGVRAGQFKGAPSCDPSCDTIKVDPSCLISPLHGLLPVNSHFGRIIFPFEFCRWNDQYKISRR